MKNETLDHKFISTTEKLKKATIPIILKDMKKHNIKHAVAEFDCGGDEMGDMNWIYYDLDEKEVDPIPNHTLMEEVTFHFVEFYVNSDGEYLGENGTVNVELTEDENGLMFTKSSTSEWDTSFTQRVKMKIAWNEVQLLKKIQWIDISSAFAVSRQDFFNCVATVDDCVITDKDIEVAKGLFTRMSEYVKIDNDEHLKNDEPYYEDACAIGSDFEVEEINTTDKIEYFLHFNYEWSDYETRDDDNQISIATIL